MGLCQGCGFYSWLKVKPVQSVCGWLCVLGRSCCCVGGDGLEKSNLQVLALIPRRESTLALLFCLGLWKHQQRPF